MSDTFTTQEQALTTQEQAQELADFYQKVADGGEIQTYVRRSSDSKPEWIDSVYGPRPNCLEFRYWRIKPTKKVIDLSVLIESGIDCEFSDSGDDKNWHINKVAEGIYQDSLYGTELGEYFEQCQPRMNHKHAWLHNNCPIEGFVVRAWFDKEDFTTVDTSFNIINWSKIMYVEFLEVEHGYVMPWEQDNE